MRRAEGFGSERIGHLRDLLGMAEYEVGEIERRNRELASTETGGLGDSRGDLRVSDEQAGGMDPTEEVDPEDPFAEGWN